MLEIHRQWEISIHAPTKGATPDKRYDRRQNVYFNPRSHEGSDEMSDKEQKAIKNFNPRSHEGSDRETYAATMGRSNFNPRSHEGSDASMPRLRCILVISIHAPTKGATTPPCFPACIRQFQSTLPRRERRLRSQLGFPTWTFQSTLPRRERH